jgi:hypothetical protein
VIIIDTTVPFTLDEAVSTLRPLLLLIAGIVIYAIFIFKFYRYLAKENIFELNLGQYSHVSSPRLRKTLALFLYSIQYFLIFPLFLFFWLAVFMVFIRLISGSNFEDILLVSMALVASIRVCAYYNEDLSRDLAKLIPFALLAIFIVEYRFLSFDEVLDLRHDINDNWKIAVYYLALTICLEFILRSTKAIFGLLRKKKMDDESSGGEA